MPPSNNEYLVPARGRFIKSAKARMFEQKLVTWRMRYFRTIPDLGPYKDKLLKIDRYFCFCEKNIFTKKGVKRKRDVSNRIKIFDDGLSKLIGIDDSMFVFGSEQFVQVENEADEQVIVRISVHEAILTKAQLDEALK